MKRSGGPKAKPEKWPKREHARTAIVKRAIDLETMLTISSDALMGMPKDEYQVVRRLATRARLDRRPRYVCGLCGHAVYAPREGRTGQPYWKHHPGAPEDCLWWTGMPSGVDVVSARQFDGAQESPLHAKIKNIFGELLTADRRCKGDFGETRPTRWPRLTSTL